MAKAYSRGLQMALGGGGQSPLRFAVMELRRMMDEMRRGDNMPSLSRLEWRRVLKEGDVERAVMEQAERAHEQAMAWAAELNVVVRALVASTTLGGGFWDGVADDDVVGDNVVILPYEDVMVATGCAADGGHDWRYVRESKDGLMRMFRCQACGEEVVM